MEEELSVSLIKPSVKEYIINKIEGIPDKDSLEEYSSEILDKLEGMLKEAAKKLEQFAPQLKLIEIPSSPDDAVTWIGDFINDFLKPALSPAINLAATVTATTADLVIIKDKIDEKQSQLDLLG